MDGQATSKAEAKPAIVLVPGGWHTIEYFSNFRKALESYGYSTEAISLPTIGAEPPLQSFDEDVKAIRLSVARLSGEGKDIVVIMHSWGRVVGSEAADGYDKNTRAKVGLEGGILTLVYVSAWAIPAGVSLAGFVEKESGPLGSVCCPWVDPDVINSILSHGSPAFEPR